MSNWKTLQEENARLRAIVDTIPDWHQFELFAMELHLQRYGGLVWHWAQCPMEIRMASGYQDSRHAGSRDYGVDFLGLGADGIWRAGQAKCYAKGRVKASDLGSFLIAVQSMKRVHANAEGVLYHTSKLESELRARVDEGRVDFVVVHVPMSMNIRKDIKSSYFADVQPRPNEMCSIATFMARYRSGNLRDRKGDPF